MIAGEVVRVLARWDDGTCEWLGTATAVGVTGVLLTQAIPGAAENWDEPRRIKAGVKWIFIPWANVRWIVPVTK